VIVRARASKRQLNPWALFSVVTRPSYAREACPGSYSGPSVTLRTVPG